MRSPFGLLLSAATFSCGLSASSPVIRAAADGRTLTLRASAPKHGVVISSDFTGHALLFGGDGCTTIENLPLDENGFVLFVLDGGCPIDTKVRTAMRIGAVAIVVGDSMSAAYGPAFDGPSAMKLKDPCRVRCDVGSGMVDMRDTDVASVMSGLPGRCPAPDTYDGLGCATSMCAFAAAPSGTEREVCCLLETAANASSPFASLSDPTIPVLWLALTLSNALQNMCTTPSAAGPFSAAEISHCSVRLSEEADAGKWDGSAVLVWVIASATAALAAYVAAEEFEVQDRESAQNGTPLMGGDVQSATIDSSTAFSFLVLASTGLLAMYFLIQAVHGTVVLLINIMFVFAAATGTAQVVCIPAATALAPPSVRSASVRLPLSLCSVCSTGEDTEVLVVQLVGTALSFALAIGWFILRRGVWAWVVQDLLSACICVLFVRTIRLPSLRIGALFLGLMFAYDIFMVFVSPLFFDGTSVMVAVATAGDARESIDEAGKCQRTQSEKIPMLMSMPRLAPATTALESAYSPPLPPEPFIMEDRDRHTFWWRLSGASGQYAMIGLGDIVLPALALAYARRIDLSKPFTSGLSFFSLVCSYYGWAVLGYALGLGVTEAANAYGWTFNDVKGQPALLYLVPGVIGLPLLRALLTGELSAVWNGSMLPQPPANLSNLGCDGCRRAMLLDESVWSDDAKNIDYCPSCYTALTAEKKAALVEFAVYRRCGVEAPATPSEPNALL